MDVPETRYAKTADGVHVAYQAVGAGPVDLVFVMGWTTNIEAMWEEPNLARFLRRLASFSRLILFDKRGVGLSDRVAYDRLPSLEVRMDDVRSVMDAVGSERAIVFGVSEGCPMAMLFAATYPERTIALALFGTGSDFTSRVFTEEARQEYLDYIDRNWGTIEHARREIRDWGAPGHGEDEGLVTWLASYLRRAASPGAAIALSNMNRQIDVTHALPAIHVPTLVLARTEDRDFPVTDTRALAGAIGGARFVEFPGDEHFFWVGDQTPLLDAVEAFVAEFRDGEACSPTSSARRRGPPRSATRDGGSSSNPITPGCVDSWPGSGVVRSTRPVTGSSRASTARRAGSGVPGRSSTPSGRPASRSARACTRVRWSRSATRSAGSR